MDFGYEGSAWILLGVSSQELTKGDSVFGFSQYGEIVNMNLTRARKTDKFQVQFYPLRRPVEYNFGR